KHNNRPPYNGRSRNSNGYADLDEWQTDWRAGTKQYVLPSWLQGRDGPQPKLRGDPCRGRLFHAEGPRAERPRRAQRRASALVDLRSLLCLWSRGARDRAQTWPGCQLSLSTGREGLACVRELRSARSA